MAAGLAGGLRPGLGIGDVVLDAGDGEFSAGLPAGRVLTCSQPVETAAHKRGLRLSSGADVCDLETAHLRKAALELGFPLWSLRAVSDTAAEDLAAPGRLLCRPGDGRADIAWLLVWLLARPARWPAFCRMVGNARAARYSLHAALAKLLPALR